jgi:D-alanyl-D-alanine carboxypeptidase
MGWVSFEARQGLRSAFRCGALALGAAAAALVITSDAALARHHRVAHSGRSHHHASAEEYSPPAASILVDGNSGAVLESSNADALRHPASLTKVMTLYLLFERLDAGKIKLDTPLHVSEHASEQAPTKLELKPGQTLTVEEAIKGIVTKSANDAAVTVAENLGGDEESFAKLMTQKAHALGMTRTTYVNASGLPDDEQLTTARDQALLGRAIQDRFPRFYRYFSTESFVYHGAAMRNHNHLLGAVEGVDGIKTGFTRASGFNLLTSLHRDGRYLVGVVMGGPSASERDGHMRELISQHFKEAALRHTAPMLADAHEDAQPYAFGKSPMTSVLTAASHAEPASTAPVSTASVSPRPGSATDPIHPVAVKTISYRMAPVQTASLGPMPALVPAVAPAPATQAVLPQPSARPQPIAAMAEEPHAVVVASADPSADRSAAARPAEVAKSESAKSESVKSEPILAPPPTPELAMRESAVPEPAASAEPPDAEPAISSARIHARGGWLIQIGAFEDETDAKQHLSAAQTKVRTALAAKDPFTERILKGDKAYYRARFAGFDRVTAEAACKQLKHSDFECMALKD